MLYPQAEIIQKIRCIWFCVKVTSNKASKALSSNESLLPKRQHTLSFTHLPCKQLMLISSELLQALAERDRLSGAFWSYGLSPWHAWSWSLSLCLGEILRFCILCIAPLASLHCFAKMHWVLLWCSARWSSCLADWMVLMHCCISHINSVLATIIFHKLK